MEKRQALDHINGFDVRPGNYLLNGAYCVPEGVNFTIHSVHALGCELVLFHAMEKEPFAVIPFPESYRIGHTYSIVIYDLDIKDLEYCYRLIEWDMPGEEPVKTPLLIDIYTKAVTGQSKWGEKSRSDFTYRSRVVEEDFDWGDFEEPNLEFKNLIIYEAHVRGFTKGPESNVSAPGTFKGLMEKIPYLLSLGVNCVELMPVFEFDELESVRDVDGHRVLNYWGYNTVSFFAPNTSYASKIEHNHEGNELKEMIKALNENGIEVILDVVFNHTAEGNEDGPTFSFKGYDKNIYYMLTPEGKFFNFSGCGNTLNCNHPVVRQMILDCLRYWTVEYRVDGFRFDLAAILGRDEDGTPLEEPPLLESLAYDPILSKVKLIAEAWDAGGLYQVGSFPAWKRWAEWNGRYRDDIRKFLKSDAGMAEGAYYRITGSEDIYNPAFRGKNSSVNFITCHDGFTLNDLYSYNEKHNESNGWNNTDGANDNASWNCGVEGETDDPAVLALRDRMKKNAFAVLLCSRGAVMFLSGDEFGNSQKGNNNAYCHDDEISWLDWRDYKKNKDLFNFVKKMIAFRKKHPVIRDRMPASKCGLPGYSAHIMSPWNSNFTSETRELGVLFTGYYAEKKRDDVVFIAMNMHWESRDFVLPEVPGNYNWEMEIITSDEICFFEDDNMVSMPGRSVAIFSGRKFTEDHVEEDEEETVKVARPSGRTPGARSAGNKTAGAAKQTGSKTAGTKTAGTKATSAKTAGTKSAGSKAATQTAAVKKTKPAEKKEKPAEKKGKPEAKKGNTVTKKKK